MRGQVFWNTVSRVHITYEESGVPKWSCEKSQLRRGHGFFQTDLRAYITYEGLGALGLNNERSLNLWGVRTLGIKFVALQNLQGVRGHEIKLWGVRYVGIKFWEFT